MFFEERILERFNNNERDLLIFDYLYREVSVKTGEGIFESINELSEILFDYNSHKKNDRLVSQIFI